MKLRDSASQYLNHINIDEAERLGITIPESISADAKYIIRNGQELAL